MVGMTCFHVETLSKVFIRFGVRLDIRLGADRAHIGVGSALEDV
jgi:hypothetical protein